MKRLVILLTILLLLAACGAKTDSPQENSDVTTEQVPVETGNETVTTTDTPVPIAEDNTPAKPATTPAEKVTEKAPEKPKEVAPLVTFIELGAESCIPCKMMQPIMKEITTEYKGLVKVVFYDLNKDRQAGQKYGVRVMPTQVFLDADGREFFRHEGFYPKDEIEKMLAAKIGVTKPK